jgi:two-component system chemotaxis sensor kinase CheA
VIVQGASGVAAFGVDRMLGAASIVFRPLPEIARSAAVIAGASLDAEGNPQLVLDCDSLVAGAQRLGASAVEPAVRGAPILIVDDSLTTRMLEQSILESAGFEVDVAASAEEGLEVARKLPHALFLVDVEMPGMDGFTFVERTRADPDLRGTPAIMVTSRDYPEDRQRAKDVGAQGYIVKGEFDQTDFLDQVRRLTA